MSQIPASQQEAVETFLSPMETIEAAHSSDEETFVVTSKRLLSLEPGDDNDRRAATTESISFDAVSNVKIDVYESEPYDSINLTVAAVVGGFGLAMFGWGVIGSGEFAKIALFASLGCGAIAAAFTYDAFNTDSGSEQIELQTSRDGGSHSISLPQSAEDVAIAVSEHAV